MPKIIFVGAGASTTAALYALAGDGQNLKGLDIMVFEKTQPFGLGVAYRTQKQYHLLNTRANRMSINAKNGSDFFGWLNDNQKLWREKFPNISKILDKEYFYPRGLYGMYLEERFSEAIELLRDLGAHIQCVNGEITGRRNTGTREYLDARLHDTNQQKQFEADIVVVAIGTSPPKPIAAFKHFPHYIHVVWNEELLKINSDSPVVVMGFGLTAIDVLLTLKENNHNGMITVCSRSGLMPVSHQHDYRVYERVIFTDDAVNQLNTPTAMAYHELLEKEIEYAEKNSYSNLIVADSLREPNEKDRANSWKKQSSFATYWQRLNNDEKVIWNQQLGARFNKLLFRAAPTSHQAITSMFEIQQVSISVGNTDNLKPDKDTVYVNCTGPDLLQNRFIKQLVDNGICELHPAGGIKVDEHLRLRGSKSSKYYAIGPFFFGERFETVSMHAITQQAQILTREIIKSLTIGNSHV